MDSDRQRQWIVLASGQVALAIKSGSPAVREAARAAAIKMLYAAEAARKGE